jgi:hypothetical protein
MCLKVLVAKAKWGIITIFMLSRHKQLQSIIYNPGIILQNKPPEINLIGNFFCADISNLARFSIVLTSVDVI